MTEHTPGVRPTGGRWCVSGLPDHVGHECIVADGPRCIATVHHVEDHRAAGSPLEVCRENSRLIAEAVNACKNVNPSNPVAAAEALPMLVEALRSVHNAARSHQVYDKADWGKVRAAIAKATEEK